MQTIINNKNQNKNLIFAEDTTLEDLKEYFKNDNPNADLIGDTTEDRIEIYLTLNNLKIDNNKIIKNE